jgi:undecaprenyl-diphosphatase
MIEWLESIDRAIVFTVNSWHTPFFDQFFWIISMRVTWIPLYLFILVVCWLSFGWRKTLLFTGIVIATIILADLSSVYLFKEMFQRYRPSHHALLTEKLHFYQIKPNEYYKGGMYGFVSSHATNFAAITVLVGMTLRRYFPKFIWWLAACALIVCFSRLYLGVHYLSDLIAGACWGATLASIMYHSAVKKWIYSGNDL